MKISLLLFPFKFLKSTGNSNLNSEDQVKDRLIETYNDSERGSPARENAYVLNNILFYVKQIDRTNILYNQYKEILKYNIKNCMKYKSRFGYMKF